MKHLFDNPFGKMETVSNPNKFRLHVTKGGDRTLTPARKRKIIEKAKFRCYDCRKKFDPAFLDVHHKKEVSSYKNPLDGGVYRFGKKYKPDYDRLSNLIVLCKKCHKDLHRKRVKRKANSRKKKAFNPPIADYGV